MRVLLVGESWLTHSGHVPDFMSWPGYDRLGANLLHWLTGQQ